MHGGVTLFGMLAIGIVLGMKHALEADHLAAVAALATRSGSVRHTILQGIAWGTGHTLTLLLVGGAILAVNGAVPERVAAALDGAVGAMLVLLGADVFRRLAKERMHVHVHRHGDVVHLHMHSHAHDAKPHDPAHHRHAHADAGHIGPFMRARPHDHADRPRLPIRAFCVGIMHGMAGTAAIVLMSATATRSFALGLATIAIFGLGTVLGMAALSVVIAMPLRWSAARQSGRVHAALHGVVGAGSVALGVSLITACLAGA
jgi:sulfite exporter TauE/SafE